MTSQPIRTRAAFILAAGLFAGAAVLGSMSSASAGGDNEGVCTGTHLSPPNDSTKSLVVTAPECKLISGYCVKAGSIHQGNGPEYFTVSPPSKTVTISHSSGKDISHYTVTYVDDTTTTTIPEVTTTIPEVTTTVPEVTTTIPEVTTTVPEVTTTVPEVTTTIPEVTTTVPEVTTTVPEITTTVPEITTTIPEECTDNCDSSRKRHPDTGANTADLAILGLGLATVGGILVVSERKSRTR